MGLSIYELNTNAENLWLDNNLNITKNIILNQANQAAGLNSIGNMAIDAFGDSTGIDATYSTNYLYNGTTKLAQANTGTTKAITATNATIISSMTNSTGIGYFNGSNTKLDVATSPSFDITSGTASTIEFFVRTTQTSQAFLMTRSEGAGVTYCSWEFCINTSSSGKIEFRTCNTATWDVDIYSTTSVNDGAWHHVALVYTGSSYKLFVDGNQEATSSYTSGTKVQTYPLTIGCQWRNDNNTGSTWFNGNLGEFRITKGIARYASNFIPQTTPFIVDANTALLLHMDTDFTDSSTSNKNFTVIGTTITNTVKKMGNGASYFNGINNYLYTTLTPDLTIDSGTGAFTIECWYKNQGIPTNRGTLLGLKTGNPAQTNWELIVDESNGGVRLWICNTDSSAWTIPSITSVCDGNWHHIALVFQGYNIILYVDGVNNGAVTTSGTLRQATTNFHIGAVVNAAGTGITQYLTGYMDEIRISKGVARYTSNFTPSITPFTADANTSLLLHMDTDFSDSSTNNKTVTVTGATITTVIKKFGNGSGYFYGNAYIDTPDSADFTIGTGNATIEFFFYRPSNFTGLGWICGQSNSTNTNAGTSFQIGIGADNLIDSYFNIASTNYRIVATNACAANAWHHVALVRTSGRMQLFVNGVREGDIACSGTINDVSNKLAIGRCGEYTASTFNGYIDSFRFSNIVRYSGTTYTVPTASFANDSNTKLLLDFEGSIGISAFLDNSSLSSIYSNSVLAATVPSKIFITADETLESGKTITYYASRDNGTTWTTCTKDVLTDISTQPSGTNIKIKAVISGGTNSTINAWAFGWK